MKNLLRLENSTLLLITKCFHHSNKTMWSEYLSWLNDPSPLVSTGTSQSPPQEKALDSSCKLNTIDPHDGAKGYTHTEGETIKMVRLSAGNNYNWGFSSIRGSTQWRRIFPLSVVWVHPHLCVGSPFTHSRKKCILVWRIMHVPMHPRNQKHYSKNWKLI